MLPNAHGELLPPGDHRGEREKAYDVASQRDWNVRLSMSTTLAWKLLWSLCRGFLFEDHPLHEPLLDVLARYLACRNRHKQGNNFLISCPQCCSIQFKKNFCHCCGKAFVAIQEGMGLGQMIGIRRCTGREGYPFVIRPVFRRRLRGVQRPRIVHPMQSSKLLNGPRLNSEYFVCTEEKQSDLLYSGPCASWVYAC
jgi:hypothetical protein